MMILGWCEKCRRIKRVRATGISRMGSVAHGVCAACEEEQKK